MHVQASPHSVSRLFNHCSCLHAPEPVRWRRRSEYRLPREVGMRFSKRSIGTLIAAFSIAASSCTTIEELLSPTRSFHAQGVVEDDGCFLPGNVAACRPVAGVRVEVMEGKEAGRVATTGADGRFDLGMLSSEPVTCAFVWCDSYTVLITASKPGWVSASGRVGGTYDVTIRMGDEPHVFWGTVYLPGNVPRPRAAGARVEIMVGPNAGKVAFTNDQGFFVFNDLVSSPQFQIDVSKDGYQTVRVSHLSGLTKNGVEDVVLVAGSQG